MVFSNHFKCWLLLNFPTKGVDLDVQDQEINRGESSGVAASSLVVEEQRSIKSGKFFTWKHRWFILIYHCKDLTGNSLVKPVALGYLEEALSFDSFLFLFIIFQVKGIDIY